MNAEERHEERENDMGGWLQYGLVNWVREYGSYVLLAGALCFLGYTLWQRHEQKKHEEFESDFISLRNAAEKNASNTGFGSINPADPKTLADLIDSTEFKEVKAQAALTLARYYQDLIPFPEEMGARNLRRDEVLDKAMNYLKIALDAQPDDLLITSKAHLGMAAVYEDQDNWDKAKQEYQLLSDPKGKYAGSAIAQLAADQLKSLPERQAAPRLVAMIPSQKPANLPLPSGLPGSSTPFDLNKPMPSILSTTEPTLPWLQTPKMGPFPGSSTPSTTPARETPSSAPASAPSLSPETAPAK